MCQRTISTIGFSLFQSSTITKIEISICSCTIILLHYTHLFLLSLFFQIYPNDSLDQVKTTQEVFEWIINRAHMTELLLNENY